MSTLTRYSYGMVAGLLIVAAFSAFTLKRTEVGESQKLVKVLNSLPKENMSEGFKKVNGALQYKQQAPSREFPEMLEARLVDDGIEYALALSPMTNGNKQYVIMLQVHSVANISKPYYDELVKALKGYKEVKTAKEHYWIVNGWQVHPARNSLNCIPMN